VEYFEFVGGDFNIVADLDADAVRLQWRGRRRRGEPAEPLTPLLDLMLAVAVDGPRRVEMSFDDVEELDANTLSELLDFLQRLEGTQVALTLIYDPCVKWQRLSFEPLRVFIEQGSPLELRQRFRSDRMLMA
jgi:hypothetical protein